MKRLIRTSILSLMTACCFAQPSSHKVFTADIDHFWNAYDSIVTTKDSIQQLHFIQSLYIDKGSIGLKTFMELRNYNAALWVKLINKYPKFWVSVRPNTLAVKSKVADIEKSILDFKTLYPSLRDARMYFTIGGLRSGGTTRDSMVLIGAEIATGNASTDVSEFTSKWLAGVFKEQSLDNIIPLNIHEYVHTQQKGQSENLLAQAITEGSCDFITELVIHKPMMTNYIQYGRLNEAALKEKFKGEMFSEVYAPWLYNGSSDKQVADLGYFMGYTICKAYYNKAADKKQAVRDIIELNYSDSNAVEAFLAKSGYYKEPFDKTALVKAIDEKRPSVAAMEPFTNGDTTVDASLKELKIVFSAPMDIHGYSINFGAAGKEHYPIASVGGFSEDGKSLVLKLDLKPGNAYEFVLTDRAFKSADGYPLKEYHVQFTTKK